MITKLNMSEKTHLNFTYRNLVMELIQVGLKVFNKILELDLLCKVGCWSWFFTPSLVSLHGAILYPLATGLTSPSGLSPLNV